MPEDLKKEPFAGLLARVTSSPRVTQEGRDIALLEVRVIMLEQEVKALWKLVKLVTGATGATREES